MWTTTSPPAWRTTSTPSPAARRSGSRCWSNFWQPFKERIDHTQENVKRSDVTQEAIDEVCPKCGSPLSIRLGRNGHFIGCTNYPECDYTRDLNADKAEAAAHGNRRGARLPGVRLDPGGQARTLRQVHRLQRLPQVQAHRAAGAPGGHRRRPARSASKGTLQKKKSRRGKIFYSCSTYPDCDYAVWNEPVAEPCPKCGWPVLTLKTTKRNGAEKVCPQKECGYRAPAEA